MSELDEQIHNRRSKRQELIDGGIVPYPHRFDIDAEPFEIQATHGEKTAEDLSAQVVHLRSAGRVHGLRRHGKLAFLDIHDARGKIQLMIRSNKLSDEGKAVLEGIDLGDYVGAEGDLIRTRMGELTLQVESLTFLAKALRPLPEKWHGLADIETRYRQRYLDLATNPESVAVFETRARIVRALRRFLDEHGFLEVETPMMHPIAGGATARPFVTHHNTLGMDLYLRVAPELYLKRLLVGGLHRVYEINRNFRNEGVSTQHNPEFTMLEFYWAYVDFEAQMNFTEEMLSTVAREATGSDTVPWQDEEIHLVRPWARFRMKDACRELAGVAAERLETIEGLTAELKERKIALPQARTYGHLLMALFEEAVEEHLFQPTFITHHPVEVSPLAKQWPEDPRFTERFELYIGGMEVANAFSELNDPDVQAERFHEQLKAREAGDKEAHQYDADYVRALEHGMPPAGGNGIGIDRLTMILTNRTSIRDVILFPQLRRLEEAEEA